MIFPKMVVERQFKVVERQTQVAERRSVPAEFNHWLQRI